MRVEEKTETKLSDEIVLGVRRAVAIHQQMLDSDPASMLDGLGFMCDTANGDVDKVTLTRI